MPISAFRGAYSVFGLPDATIARWTEVERASERASERAIERTNERAVKRVNKRMRTRITFGH